MFMNFDERVAAHLGRMSAAEQRVARVFQENREEVLFASAAALATKAATSDATVVRATKALGFKGMDELRRSIAEELKQNASLSSRLAETLREARNDLGASFNLVIDTHLDALGNIRRDLSVGLFEEAVSLIAGARRVVIFGIGPSGALALYFAMQLERLGLDAMTMTQTGRLFADDLHRLRSGDVLIAMAYSQIYRELDVLLDEGDRLGIAKIVVTDSLGGSLRPRVDIVLPVERGRADMLSMHTATLGALEALLVGIAVKRPESAMQSLESLNRLRGEIGAEERGRSTDDAR
jgi:DNA-binding MurR/RpiR family transcriptional regulator